MASGAKAFYNKDLHRIVKVMIKFDEGYRLKAYQCTQNVWTIGYGSTRGVYRGMVITAGEAEVRYMNDIHSAFSDAAYVTRGHWAKLSNVRKAVVINMAHALGRGRLMKFVEFRRGIARKDYSYAGMHILDSKWARSKKNPGIKFRAQRLRFCMEHNSLHTSYVEAMGS